MAIQCWKAQRIMKVQKNKMTTRKPERRWIHCCQIILKITLKMLLVSITKWGRRITSMQRGPEIWRRSERRRWGPSCDWRTLHLRKTKEGLNRKHVCEECGYTSSQKGDLNKHRETVHEMGEKTFNCELCLYKSYEKRNLRDHVRKIYLQG